jgi:hypothetical protein
MGAVKSKEKKLAGFYQPSSFFLNLGSRSFVEKHYT